MTELATQQLAPGQSFYVIVGSSAAALGLLLIGIHNAWDTVTHIVAADVHRDASKKG